MVKYTFSIWSFGSRLTTTVSVAMVTQLFAQLQINIYKKTSQEETPFYTANGITIRNTTNVLCVSQFATVEVAITFIKDEFGREVLRFLKREELLTLVVCFLCFLLGLPHVTKVQYVTAALLLFQPTW